MQESPEHPFIKSPAKAFASVSSPSHSSNERRTLFPVLTVEKDAPVFGSEVSASVISNVRAETSEETATSRNSAMEICPGETAQHKTVNKLVKKKKVIYVTSVYLPIA